MKENKAIKLGIVGCGDISNAHGNAIMNIENARFSACCDLNEKRSKDWADKYNCDRYYVDYLKMLQDEELDGVVLATWPNQHTEQISHCAAAGIKNILCQKSLTLTSNEAIEIKKIIEMNRIFLMEGFMYRHHPAIKKLESLLMQGEIGPVDNVRAVFSDFDPENEAAEDTDRNWRQRKECGGGIPYDFACYAVNACDHFCGGFPSRVFASGNISDKYGTINRLYGMIEYDNGSIGIVESSKKSSFNQELQISCANGILNLPLAWTIYGEVSIQQIFRSEWAHVLNNRYTIPKTDSYLLEMKNFVNVIRGIAEPGMPINESIINIFVIEALVNSMLNKEIVTVTLPDQLTNS